MLLLAGVMGVALVGSMVLLGSEADAEDDAETPDGAAEDLDAPVQGDRGAELAALLDADGALPEAPPASEPDPGSETDPDPEPELEGVDTAPDSLDTAPEPPGGVASDEAALTAETWRLGGVMATGPVTAAELSAIGMPDALQGSEGADTLSGGAAADLIAGGAGDDWIDGYGGDDAVAGQGGADHLRGGAGDDTLAGGAGADRLDGDRGDDLLAGGAGADSLFGHIGDDTLAGGGGADSLQGGGGADLLAGGAGADAVHGHDGADTLAGGTGADSLFGGRGDDVISGAILDPAGAEADAPDYLNGGAGEDTIHAGRGDVVTGGAGADSVVLDAARAGPPAALLDLSPEDRVAIRHDAGATPEITLAPDPEDPGTLRLALDGAEIATLPAGSGLTAEAVTLIPRAG